MRIRPRIEFAPRQAAGDVADYCMRDEMTLRRSSDAITRSTVAVAIASTRTSR